VLGLTYRAAYEAELNTRDWRKGIQSRRAFRRTSALRTAMVGTEVDTARAGQLSMKQEHYSLSVLRRLEAEAHILRE
jgi:hypothetical protein